MNKVMSFQIIKPIGIEWNVFGKILKELQWQTMIAENTAMLECRKWMDFEIQYKEKNGVYPKIEDQTGYTTIDGYCYNLIKSKATLLNTGNLITSLRNATSKFKSNKVDILVGKISLPSFKKDLPLDIHNKNIRIMKSENNEYIASLSLLSGDGKTNFEMSCGQIPVILKVVSGSQKSIIDRCINGTYKISASQIIHKTSKNKWMLNLCYGFEVEETPVDKTRVMGVDLGIVNPAYMAFSFDDYGVSIKDDRIIQSKIRMDKELSQAKSVKKYIGQGSVGHGRKCFQKVYTSYANKSHNLSDTINHAWSKFIVNTAVRNGCGTIQMEDLSGVKKAKPKKPKKSKTKKKEVVPDEEVETNATDNKFLKNWTYYDLQQKIAYKAKEKGIQVIKVNPKYTSQRCSKCGHIEKSNRPTQAEFVCVNCGYKANADYNAAKNLSVLGIDKIIAESVGTKKD